MTNEEKFNLDTKGFATAAEKCKDLAREMLTLRQNLDKKEVIMVNSWTGEGAKAFKKKYSIIVRQMDDIKNNLYDIAEDIYKANDTYIQTDVDAAKALEGIQSVGTGKTEQEKYNKENIISNGSGGGIR